MSWKATAWAKATRGHRSVSDKLVLMVLADYTDSETDEAWPSQKTLSEDCEMSIRNTRRCLQSLQDAGFIAITNKGNQHKETCYVLKVDVTYVPFTRLSTDKREPSEEDTGVLFTSLSKGEPDNLSPSPESDSEPDTQGQVNRTPRVSEPDTSVPFTSLSKGEPDNVSPSLESDSEPDTQGQVNRTPRVK